MSTRRKCVPEGTNRVKRRCDKSLLLLQQAEKSHFSCHIKGRNMFPFPAGAQGEFREMGWLQQLRRQLQPLRGTRNIRSHSPSRAVPLNFWGSISSNKLGVIFQNLEVWATWNLPRCYKVLKLYGFWDVLHLCSYTPWKRIEITYFDKVNLKHEIKAQYLCKNLLSPRLHFKETKDSHLGSSDSIRQTAPILYIFLEVHSALLTLKCFSPSQSWESGPVIEILILLDENLLQLQNSKHMEFTELISLMAPFP